MFPGAFSGNMLLTLPHAKAGAAIRQVHCAPDTAASTKMQQTPLDVHFMGWWMLHRGSWPGMAETRHTRGTPETAITASQSSQT